MASHRRWQEIATLITLTNFMHHFIYKPSTIMKLFLSASGWLSVLLIMSINSYASTAPAMLDTKHVFTIEAVISAPLEIGKTPTGKRLSIPIRGGTFYGQKLNGKVLPGGADSQLITCDGTVKLDARYMIQTDDGILIKVNNTGILVPATDNKELYFRTTPTFDAPEGKYQWLNEAIFITGIRSVPDKPDTVLVDVYKVL